MEKGGSNRDGIGFFQTLVRSTAADISFCMSPEVKAFWSSHGLLEDGFMRYLAPFIEVVRGLLDEKAGLTDATAQQ